MLAKYKTGDGGLDGGDIARVIEQRNGLGIAGAPQPELAHPIGLELRIDALQSRAGSARAALLCSTGNTRGRGRGNRRSRRCGRRRSIRGRGNWYARPMPGRGSRPTWGGCTSNSPRWRAGDASERVSTTAPMCFSSSRPLRYWSGRPGARRASRAGEVVDRHRSNSSAPPGRSSAKRPSGSGCDMRSTGVDRRMINPVAAQALGEQVAEGLETALEGGQAGGARFHPRPHPGHVDFIVVPAKLAHQKRLEHGLVQTLSPYHLRIHSCGECIFPTPASSPGSAGRR